jgi:hypothetical protein
MDVRERVQKVFDAEKNDAQLDLFLADVRDSLRSSNRDFLRYLIVAVGSIVIYHLVVYGGSKGVSVGGIELTDSSLFRQTFLLIPAAALACSSGVGYLRRLQREVFDYLSISRYRVLGQTGLHELRLPGDYLLGFFLLNIEGNRLGKVIGVFVVSLLSLVTTILPTVYILIQASANIRVFGREDMLCDTASGIAVFLCLIALIVAWMGAKIKA